MPLPSTYPVEVPSDSPVLDGLVPFMLDGRDPLLPPLYLYKDGVHPLRGDSSLEARTIVYLVDTTAEGKKAAHAIAESLDVPYGPIGRRPTLNKGLQGLLELEPGDFIFARDKDGQGAPEDDMLQAFVGHKYTDLKSKEKDVCRSRLALLGPRSVRQHQAVWFEQQPRAHPVKPGQRCYGISSMTQQPKLTEGPPASMKIVDNKFDETQEVVHEALRAFTDFNIAVWERQAPLQMRTCLGQYASMINVPAIGSSRNYMWSSVQANYARPQHVTDERPLSEEMGVFGGPHRDTRDCAASLSCALVLSDLPANYEPGRLHLLGLGVYTSLPLYRQFFFSGLLRHGGTSPLAADSVVIPKWAHRMLVICYPHTSFVFGNVKHTLAALPYSGLPFHLSQEMTGAPYTSTTSGLWTSRSNYANDGAVVMEPEGHFRFFVRGLLQAIFMFLRQLPSSYDVEVDSETLLSSITMALGDTRISVNGWDLAPSGDVNARFNAEHKRVQEAVLKTLYDHLSRGIPSVRSPHAFSGFDLMAPSPVGRPNDYQRLADSTRFEQDSSDDKRDRKRSSRSKRAKRAKHLKRRVVRSSGNDTSSEDGDDESSDVDKGGDEGLARDESLSATGRSSSHIVTSRKRQLYFSSTDSDEHVSGHKRVKTNHTMEVLSDRESARSISDIPGLAQGQISPTVTDLAIGNSQRTIDGPGNSIDEDIAEAAFGQTVTVGSGYRHRECSVFIRRFNSSAIWGVIRQVTDVVRDLKHVTASKLATALSCMEDIESAMSGNSLDLSDVPLYSLSLLKLRRYCDTHEVWASVYHACIMTSESLTTRSIYSILEYRCPRIVASGATIQPDQDWLTRLTLTVLQLVRSGVPIRADPSVYLGTDVAMCTTFVDSDEAVRRRKNLNRVDVTAMTCVYVQQILQQWFSLSVPFIAQARALFVDLLVEHMGHTSLFMPFVWDVYVELPSWLFTTNSPTRTEIEYHPDTSFSSTFLSDFAYTLDKSSEAALARTHLQVLQQQLDQLWSSASAASRSRSLGISGANAAPVPGPSSGELDEGRSTPAEHNEIDHGSVIPLIMRFLHDGWVAAEAAFTGDLNQLTDEQTIMANEGDFLVSIRELAPSRRLVNMPTTGIDSAFAQTAAGLFSLLVFRNISFNTEAFRMCTEDMRQIRFTTLEEWNHYIDVLRNTYHDKPIDFICNRFSYGQPLRHRTIELASGFWNVAHECRWPIPSTPGELPTFSSAMRWIKQLKSSYKDKLADFGLLGQYMLAADMVASGVVDIPTCGDVGTVIDRLSAGGKRGLEDLQLISGSATRTEIVEAFTALVEVVGDALSEDERSAYQWNPITAEHMLCKFHRMQNRGYYKLV